ncbi:MAG: hypothetical protein ACXVJ1_15615 [Candidatus Angelobacter sp.]
MKKYLLPTIVLILVAAGIFIRYEIVAPARAAALDLEAINGLTVGRTTEAELLGRSAFQKIDRQCFQADCFYHMETENKFLNRLHLAPFTFFNTAVWVRNGMVVQVDVFVTRAGLTPISLSQKRALPAECASNPCAKHLVLPNKKLVKIQIMFTDESEFRNRMPEAVQTACLSRLHGCNTYAELLPVTKNLNLEGAAQQPASGK